MEEQSYAAFAPSGPEKRGSGFVGERLRGLRELVESVRMAHAQIMEKLEGALVPEIRPRVEAVGPDEPAMSPLAVTLRDLEQQLYALRASQDELLDRLDL